MLFAVTFGQRHRYEPHPYLEGVTHQSYLVVEAKDEMDARIQLGETIDNVYAMIYDLDSDFERQIIEYGLCKLPYKLKDGLLVDD